MKLFPNWEVDIGNLKRVSDDNSVIMQNQETKIKELEKKIDELIKNTPPNLTEYANRLAEIELKTSKIWTQLIAESPVRKDIKLTTFGKGFKKRFER